MFKLPDLTLTGSWSLPRSEDAVLDVFCLMSMMIKTAFTVLTV